MSKQIIQRQTGRCEYISVCCFQNKDCLTERCGLYLRINSTLKPTELENPMRVRLYIDGYARRLI